MNIVYSEVEEKIQKHGYEVHERIDLYTFLVVHNDDPSELLTFHLIFPHKEPAISRLVEIFEALQSLEDQTSLRDFHMDEEDLSFYVTVHNDSAQALRHDGAPSETQNLQFFSQATRIITALNKKGIYCIEFQLQDFKIHDGQLYLDDFSFLLDPWIRNRSSRWLPDYVAPEIKSGEIDSDTASKSDIYTLGVMLHELWLGQLPRDDVGLYSSSDAKGERYDKLSNLIKRSVVDTPSDRIEYQEIIEGLDEATKPDTNESPAVRV